RRSSDLGTAGCGGANESRTPAGKATDWADWFHRADGLRVVCGDAGRRAEKAAGKARGAQHGDAGATRRIAWNRAGDGAGHHPLPPEERAISARGGFARHSRHFEEAAGSAASVREGDAGEKSSGTGSFPNTAKLERLVGAAGGRIECERNLVGDFEAVAFERDHAARMVGEHADALQSQINQNLRADPAFALHEALPAEILFAALARVIQDARKRGAFLRRFDLESAAGVVQIDEHAAILRGDSRERSLDCGAAITGG